MTTSDLVIPSRFRGPENSGNGGWTAGALAALVGATPRDHAQDWPTVEVTLRMPPPLETQLPVVIEDDSATATVADGQPVAVARRVDNSLSPVAAVSFDEARAAEPTYGGFRSHPFPNCFTCGPARAEGDGLRIFPGRVAPEKVAATWTPHASVAEDFHAYVDDHARASVEATWAALDCSGGWSGDLEGRPSVLGRITAHVYSLPLIGEPHVVVGEQRGLDGRKLFTAATLYNSSGREVARAEHVWVAVDPSLFPGNQPAKASS